MQRINQEELDEIKDFRRRMDGINDFNGLYRTDTMDRMDTRDRMNEKYGKDGMFWMRTTDGIRMDDKDEIKTTDGIRMVDNYDMRGMKDDDIVLEYDLDDLDEPTPEQVRENRENLR